MILISGRFPPRTVADGDDSRIPDFPLDRNRIEVCPTAQTILIGAQLAELAALQSALVAWALKAARRLQARTRQARHNPAAGESSR